MARVSGFSLLPALSLLATLVLLPLISRRFGPAGWVALALGQSIGALVSVVVGMAWPIIGGNLVARATTTQEKMSIFRASAYSRIIVLGILLLIAVPITILLSDHYPWSTTFFMVGVSLNGLTATWYFAGIGRPRQLILNEGVVRLVGYIVALAGLLLGGNLGWYGAVTIVIGLVMFSVNWWTIMGRSRLWLPGSVNLALRTIHQQIAGTASRILQASFAFGGPTIFSLVAPLQLPLYSALYQVQRAGNNSLNILPSAFVSWVGSASSAERRRRMRNSIAFIGAVCLIIIISWVSLGPLILDFLFANRFSLSVGGNFLLAMSMAAVLFCKSLELLILVPLGRAKLVFASNSTTSLIGVILVIIGAIAFGALGGIGASALSYGALASFYLSVVVRKSRELERIRLRDTAYLPGSAH